MKKPATIVAVTLSALALAGGVGVGIAAADPNPAPSASAPSSAAPSSRPGTQQHQADGKKNAHRRGLAARALHGEATVGGAKKTRVVDFQRGSVTEVNATSVTIKSVDGFSAKYVVDAKTKVRKDKKQAGIADVKTGDRVRVLAQKDGSTVTAKRIGDRGSR